VTLYRPGATGNARPEALITKGIDGPGGVSNDPLGDLWVAYESGKVVEYSRAELANASPIAGPPTELNWPWAAAIEP
jgi:hypothetical protein